jgi:hypothetical protein
VATLWVWTASRDAPGPCGGQLGRYPLLLAPCLRNTGLYADGGRWVTEIAETGTAEVEASEAIESEGDDLPYVGRVAICFLTVSHDVSPKKAFGDITRELKNDPRVASIDVPSVTDPDSLLPFSVSTFDSDAEDDEMTPDPYSHFHTFTFRSPITMHIRAPRRLQQTYSRFSDIPAEEYWVAWDGMALSVIWVPEKAAGKTGDTVTVGDLVDALSPSGGLVVQQILKEAASKCDYDFHTVECSPNCDYTFLHADLVLQTVGPEQVTSFQEPDERTSLTSVDLGVEHDPYAALAELHSEIQFSARMFTLMRCANDAMIEIARFAHRNNARLLRLNYERANASAQGFWSSLVGNWKLRGWKRRARRYMARINLALSALEKLRMDWARYKPPYDSSAKDENNGAVFKNEYELSVEAMSTLQVSEVRSTVEHLTASLDTNSLVLATAIGAVAGAIIGALIGTLL